MIVKPSDTIAVWFSCGAASTVAAKLTLDKYRGTCTVRVVNNPVAEEDSDNRRFLRDIEQWLGVEIEMAINRYLKGYKASALAQADAAGEHAAIDFDWMKEANE